MVALRADKSEQNQRQRMQTPRIAIPAMQAQARVLGIGRAHCISIAAEEQHSRGTQEPNEKHDFDTQTPPEDAGKDSEGDGDDTVARDGMQWATYRNPLPPMLVFLASNVMSGYLGNSFNAAYGLSNAVWSIYMFRKAYIHDQVVARAEREIPAEVQEKLKKHSHGHKISATVDAVSVIISVVGSEISSTLRCGYVILIPCIAGSIFCNTFYWRFCLGYDRASIRNTPGLSDSNITHQLETTLRRAANVRSVFWPTYMLTI
ncbi:hypothetical protein AC579_10610 [Pseudocercospora musae]|uniref:Uncharacterized protein n=1 Tax=Pseudocercospora musae TaxID=113226 RepID=A0A139ILD2_9PEZI|nr:hypothetical protein AC579_10610 [Pseudocercospora musae]